MRPDRIDTISDREKCNAADDVGTAIVGFTSEAVRLYKSDDPAAENGYFNGSRTRDTGEMAGRALRFVAPERNYSIRLCAGCRPPDHDRRSLADPGAHSIALTTEGKGVALLAGADLGGARGVLLMQSSGTGSCVNMLSLIKGGRFPLLTPISLRGDFGEGNPWQFPMGQAVQPVLEAMGSSACASSSRRDEPRCRGADRRRGAHLYDGRRHGRRRHDRSRPRAPRAGLRPGTCGKQQVQASP